MGQLFENNQQIKKWDERKTEFYLIENEKFLIAQITHAFPNLQKKLDVNLRMSQYKLLNNGLYLNHMLFGFKKVYSPLCSYCNEQEEETPLHLFQSCVKNKQLWNKLRQYLPQFINIQHSTPQSSIVEIFDNNQHSMLINYLLLI